MPSIFTTSIHTQFATAFCYWLLNPDVSKDKFFYLCGNEPLLYTGALREVFLNNRPLFLGFPGQKTQAAGWKKMKNL